MDKNVGDVIILLVIIGFIIYSLYLILGRFFLTLFKIIQEKFPKFFYSHISITPEGKLVKKFFKNKTIDTFPIEQYQDEILLNLKNFTGFAYKLSFEINETILKYLKIKKILFPNTKILDLIILDTQKNSDIKYIANLKKLKNLSIKSDSPQSKEFNLNNFLVSSLEYYPLKIVQLDELTITGINEIKFESIPAILKIKYFINLNNINKLTINYPVCKSGLIDMKLVKIKELNLNFKFNEIEEIKKVELYHIEKTNVDKLSNIEQLTIKNVNFDVDVLKFKNIKIINASGMNLLKDKKQVFIEKVKALSLSGQESLKNKYKFKNCQNFILVLNINNNLIQDLKNNLNFEHTNLDKLYILYDIRNFNEIIEVISFTIDLLKNIDKQFVGDYLLNIDLENMLELETKNKNEIEYIGNILEDIQLIFYGYRSKKPIEKLYEKLIYYLDKKLNEMLDKNIEIVYKIPLNSKIIKDTQFYQKMKKKGYGNTLKI